MAPTGRHPSAAPSWAAAEAVTHLYAAHYRSLVRLAALLLRDTSVAEEVVQDSFVAMHGAWRRLADPDRALAYLRQSVVNRSRSALRHRTVVARHAPRPAPDAASAEHGAMVALEHAEVTAALRLLPQRQREVLVLRYYADLSESDIADAIGISRGAVKSHASRGMAALRTTLEGTS
ncbi:MAG: SigE family RNA polymerase sigma factor [Spirochaetaceae bacterium]|nr:SigE family RNA polymerase sigma factor [Spirochaetaceae bacterium]